MLARFEIISHLVQIDNGGSTGPIISNIATIIVYLSATNVLLAIFTFFSREVPTPLTGHVFHLTNRANISINCSAVGIHDFEKGKNCRCSKNVRYVRGKVWKCSKCGVVAVRWWLRLAPKSVTGRARYQPLNYWEVLFSRKSVEIKHTISEIWHLV